MYCAGMRGGVQVREGGVINGKGRTKKVESVHSRISHVKRDK